MSSEKGVVDEHEGYHKEGAGELSPEYRDYLMSRHGTVELDPLPDMNDADPYNWPKWKVRK